MENSNEPTARRGTIGEAFAQAAQWTSQQCGRPSTFIFACAVIVVWAVTGPLFGYSDTWQLIINTGTTIITFLMVFLIQNTQNRDMSALHLKLDELIRVNENARNQLLMLEDMTEEEQALLKGGFSKLADTKQNVDLLHGAEEDLAAASEEIREAKQKVSAIAKGKV